MPWVTSRRGNLSNRRLSDRRAPNNSQVPFPSNSLISNLIVESSRRRLPREKCALGIPWGGVLWALSLFFFHPHSHLRCTRVGLIVRFLHQGLSRILKGSNVPNAARSFSPPGRTLCHEWIRSAASHRRFAVRLCAGLAGAKVAPYFVSLSFGGYSAFLNSSSSASNPRIRTRPFSHSASSVSVCFVRAPSL